MSIIKTLAQQHDLSESAVQTLADALRMGNYQSAQFNHPELGGMGQWMPTMVMVGDMFNNRMKARVDDVCRALIAARADIDAGSSSSASTMAPMPTMDTVWWRRAGLAQADFSGGQNEDAYAYSNVSSRLAVKRPGGVMVYDLRGLTVTGFSAQNQSLLIHTTTGDVKLADLTSRRVPVDDA